MAAGTEVSSDGDRPPEWRGRGRGFWRVRAFLPRQCTEQDLPMGAAAEDGAKDGHAPRTAVWRQPCRQLYRCVAVPTSRRTRLVAAGDRFRESNAPPTRNLR